MTAPDSSLSRLLIRAPNWLGDAVMALPAMAAVRHAFPRAALTIAAPESMAPLFHEGTGASPDAVLPLTSAVPDARAFGGDRFDAVILLPNSFRSAWVARQAGIRERWGYAGGFRGALLTRALARPRGAVHQSEYYLALVRGLVRGDQAAPEPPSLPRLTVSSATSQRATELLLKHDVAPGATVVGFAPGAAYGHAKRWPPARVAQVVTRLVREHDAACVLVGAAGDRDAGREIESTLPPGVRVVNLIGRTDVRLLAGVLARCAAFVSNDSGAMHLAAAIGVPVAALFGPTDDRVTAPLGDHDVLIHQVFCRPCMLRDCPIDHRCMKGITPDAVVAAVSARLVSGHAGRSPR